MRPLPPRSYFAIFGALFGFRNFGRLVAIDNTFNGLFGLLQVGRQSTMVAQGSMQMGCCAFSCTRVCRQFASPFGLLQAGPAKPVPFPCIFRLPLGRQQLRCLPQASSGEYCSPSPRCFLLPWAGCKH